MSAPITGEALAAVAKEICCRNFDAGLDRDRGYARIQCSEHNTVVFLPAPPERDTVWWVALLRDTAPRGQDDPG